MTTRTSKKNMALLGPCAILLVLVMSVSGIANAGLVKNETNTDANMMYLFWSIAHIPANSSLCVTGLIDFPYFVCGDLNCPIPFFTSGTTVRIYYNQGKIDCCRDCITNTCNSAKADASHWLGEAFDHNEDGIIQQDELVVEVAKAFEKADTDGSGLVTGEELGMPEDVLKQIDADGDGAISRDEAIAFMAALFAKVDTNGDGMIIAAELT